MSDNAKKPADTPFKQQRLPAWQPILSPPWVICCFVLVAAVFIPIGALVLVASGKVVEYEIRYDVPESDSKAPNMCGAQPCAVWKKIEIEEEMKPPVYLYYKLENFYQNHRRYAKSRDDNQLAGNDVAFSKLDNCKPLRAKGDLQGEADQSAIYAPCGLIAWSMFNDTFNLYSADAGTDCSVDPTVPGCKPICLSGLMSSNTVASECNKSGIAWKSDRDRKFKKPQENYVQSKYGDLEYYKGEEKGTSEGHIIPIQTDEDFMVWMRTASLPTFRKLYRRFETYTFHKGKVIWIKIDNRFPVAAFGGKKFVILSTTSWIGGKNYFLGTAYIVVGCLCFILALVFVVKHLTGRGNQGDVPSFPQTYGRPN